MTSTQEKEMKLPIVIVDNVYFLTQRLRIKVDDSNSLLKNYQGNIFGIVSKNKDINNLSQMGVLVRIVKEESFVERSPFIRNYTDFVVECTKRIKISQDIRDLSHFDRSSQIVIAKVQVLDENIEESEIQEIKDLKLDETLRVIAVKYCTIPRLGIGVSSVLQQKAKAIQECEDVTKLSFRCCALLLITSNENKYQLLETNSVKERIVKCIQYIKNEIEISEENNEKRKNQMKLNGVGLKDIFSGFKGSMPSAGNNDNKEAIDELKAKFDKIELPEETKTIVDKELKNLARMHPSHHEYSNIEKYLETIAELPWNLTDSENLDPENAQNILDEDHYGLDKVKRRIVEFLAVRKLMDNHKGTILCFNGPPGVGKTSLGKSIAKALGRKFYRIALGGIKDESLIRGFRRTYVGSTPGVIIQSLKKVQSCNPVFLLDEIDKIGNDWKGDTSSAMLEVLDPEQNNKFTDHYLATPFDLSQVMFIATANSLESVHPALLDRMEIIDISGYSVKEKVQISLNYLIPKQIKENGINEKVIVFKNPIVQKIVQEYTMESGVRNLERCMGSVCRTVAYDFAIFKDRDNFAKISVDEKLVTKALGYPKFNFVMNKKIERPGLAIGLAYTTVGGKALLIETARFPGNGQLKLTGKLGDVMKESVTTAMSWIRTNSIRLGITEDKILKKSNRIDVLDEESLVHEAEFNSSIFSKFDIHCHFPAAAIPKDGPSAGVTITTALVSLFTNRRVKNNIAMTGEISLHGDVLPVGGIKEKCIAAMQNGIKTVLLPAENELDAEELPADVKEGLELRFCTRIEEVLGHALSKNIDENFIKNSYKPLFTSKL